MNYFNLPDAAERYAKGRPDFHHHTIGYIKKFLQLEQQVDTALDIACGTGLSTKALLEIATHVYGTDSSTEMIQFAGQKESIHYSIAAAEKQPFPDRFFDLVTVSSGVHWFAIDPFLTEANRILKDNAWLVIYDNFFLSEMENVPAFNRWFPEVYLKEFPSPPRIDHYQWTVEHLRTKNLVLAGEHQFKNKIEFTKKELIEYLVTQSNIISFLHTNKKTLDEIKEWLDDTLTVFFSSGSEKQVFGFGNWIKFLRRAS